MDEDGLDNVVFSYQWVRSDLNTNADTDIDGATDAAYTVTAEDEEKGLKVRVTFSDDDGNEESLTSYAVLAAALPVLPPDAPEDLNVAAQGIETLNVSWAAPSNDGGSAITGYKVQWKGSADSWDTPEDVSEETTTGTAHTIEGLTGGVEYAVRVIVGQRGRRRPAVGRDDRYPCGGSPGGAGGKSKLRWTRRLTPQNLTAAVNEDGSITLTWDAPDDDTITGYRILRRRPSEGEKTLLVYVEDTGSTSATYADSGVTPGIEHVYRVKAINEAGVGGQSNSVSTTPQTDEAEPNSPARGVPTITGTAQVGETLTADTAGIADADELTNVSYSYQWVADDGTSDTDITGATDSTYTLAASNEGKTIKVQVSFTDDAGNDESLTSAATEVVEAEPQEPPAKPTGLTGTVAHDLVSLRWNDPGDESITGYQILRLDRDVHGLGTSRYTLTTPEALQRPTLTGMWRRKLATCTGSRRAARRG